MSKIMLFIPFYNCERQLPRVLKQVSEYQHHFHHILLVDNKSIDSSLDKALDCIRELKIENAAIIQNVENYNLGGSHKIAFKYANERDTEFVLVLHGDNQADLKDIIPFLNKDFLQSHDCFLGARFHRDSKLIGYSKFRTYGNILLNILCSLSCRFNVLDMGSGLNLYSRHFFSDIRILNFPNDLTFNVFLLFHSSFNKHKNLFFPISWKEEDQISNAKILKQSKAIIILIIKTIFNRNLIYQYAESLTDYKYQVVKKENEEINFK